MTLGGPVPTNLGKGKAIEFSDQEVEDIGTRYRRGDSMSMIASDYNISPNTLERRLPEWGIEKRGRGAWSPIVSKRASQVNHRAFTDLTQAEDAYWLGMLMTDGNVSRRPGRRVSLLLKTADGYLVEQFRDFICPGGPIEKIAPSRSPSSDNMSTGGIQFRFNSMPVGERLIGLGMKEAKSFAASLPAPDLPLVSRHHFWRGVIDGDGGILVGKIRSQSRLCLYTHYDMCQSFKSYVESHGLSCGGIYRRAGSAVVQVSGSNAAAMLQVLYQAEGPAMRRKAKAAHQVIEQWRN